MAMHSTNEFKPGLKIIVDGEPCSILENEFVKPGKGQAFNRVKFKNLRTGRVLEKTYKSGEQVEAADVMELEMQYLYSDGKHWHFMSQDTYEQYEMGTSVMTDACKWLKGEEICTVILWNDMPILISPPNFVTLSITTTDPEVRGNTASGGVKPATLETGAVIKVPLFIELGEQVKIDTRTGAYIGRDK